MRLVSAFIATALASSALSASEGYYRTPTLRGDTLVFSAEGDLWRTTTAGGKAYRLTTHPEVEFEPKLSPDGRWIAFTAHYDGAEEAYVMPVEGGVPRQISFEGGRLQVRGWSPDGRVLFSSMDRSGPTPRVLRLVDPDSLDMEELPLTGATNGVFKDEDDLFFVRFGMEMNNDNAKLYRGGGMAQLWHFETDREQEAVRLAADFDAPILQPMWWDDRLYFITDKGGSDNIWSMNERGEDPRQHTNHSEWDVREALLDGGRIVYRLGANIRMLDVRSGSDSEIRLNITTDADASREKWVEKPLDYLTSARLGGGDDQIALTARGKVAVASTGPLRLVDLPIPETARARSATISKDGKSVYAIVDDGEYGEIWRFPLNGVGEAQQLTQDADARRWQFEVSPDGKSIVHADGKERLWLLNVETGKNTLIEEATDALGNDVFGGISFSKDGKLIAYHHGDNGGSNNVYLYEVSSGQLQQVTSSKYESFDPAFSEDGNWLYFVSNRNFRATPGSPWGDRNMGPQFDKRGQIYALALIEGQRFPFQPDDELVIAAKADEDSSTEAETDATEDAAEEASASSVDWDGLANRLFEVPVPAGNYRFVSANKSFLYVFERGANGSGTIKSLKIENKEPKLETFSGGVNAYELSLDGQQLFFSKGPRTSGQLYIAKAGAKAPQKLGDIQVRTKNWKFAVNPSTEWQQIFADAWRMHRDFSFDPGMRGLDWSVVRAKYEPLVARVGHRTELHDLIGQMTSELGILHSQIGGGDLPQDQQAGTDSALGAVFERARNGMRIKHIYQTEPGLPSARGPLQRPGVDAAVGDILLAVNGQEIGSHSALQRALKERAGEQVLLSLQRGNSAPHQTVVTPTSMRANTLLRYRDWVETNAQKVRTAHGDSIGYLHIRAMGGNDIAAFARDFYEHWDKDGIIIDVRGNRGGNIDSWLIQTFLRKVWAFWHFNGRTLPYGNMQQTFRGHVAVLMNQSTYSDGETFAAGMKALDLAPLIGTRTAGAGIWLSDRNRQSDGGIARIAESAQFGLDGRWLIEGRGVLPTLEVENPPFAEYQGEDRQLQTAIDYLLEKIRSEPIPPFEGQRLPPVGSYGRDIRD